MHRLFIHFCIFLLLAVLGLGWSLEQLWRSEQQELPHWLAPLKQSIASLATDQPDPDTLSQQLNLPVTSLTQGSVAWPESEAARLAAGEAVALFGPDGGLFLYVYQGQELWQIGPVSEAPDQHTYWYNLVFFVLLALLTALWLWPLARDLKRLDRQLRQFAPATSQPLTLPGRSLIAPLAHSFNQMQEHIQHLLRLQRELSQAVSHDLRTPLARMKFALGMLPKTGARLDQEDREHLLQDIGEMEQMVDSLLDYARLESQQDLLQVEQVNLHELCYHLAEKLNGLPGPIITLDLQANQQVQADGHYLERALTNLLTNARRHACQQVWLRVPASHKGVIIVVDDDGPGVPAAQRQQILQPFVRLDQSRSRESGGAGLGLTIVNRICHWHRGRLEIGSSPTGGARFTLWLPDCDQTQPAGL